MLRVCFLIPLLCLACGREKDVPCRELEPGTSRNFPGEEAVDPPVEWGLVDRDLSLDFLAEELPTCREGKTTSALISITDPLNDELPNTFEVVAPSDEAAHVTVHFHPVRLGLHHLTVRFLPIGGTRQRDVLITRAPEGPPLVLPWLCHEVFRLSGGTVLCDEKVIAPDGGVAMTLHESGTRSAFNGDVWEMRPQTIAHYREVDAGQLETLQYQSLADAPGWIKVLGGPNDAIGVTDSNLTMITPADGGLALSLPFRTAVAPNIRTALRVGDGVYVVRPIYVNGVPTGQTTVCGYSRVDSTFTAQGDCRDFRMTVMGATAEGFWTFEPSELAFAAIEPDGGLSLPAASQRLPHSFGVQVIDDSRPAPDQLPIFWSSTPGSTAFVPVRRDGGVELLSFSPPRGAVIAANSRAVWWVYDLKTTVYPLP